MGHVMEKFVLVFREQLTAEQEAVVVGDITAIDLKQELATSLSSLPAIIDLISDDIDPETLAIYSATSSEKMSLMMLRDWCPLYRLKLAADLIAFIEKFAALIEQLSTISSGISELDIHLRSYAHHINQAVGSDVRSFRELGELLQIDLISSERHLLAGLIRSELEHHLLV